jgi:uncharacterized protein with HEPN domain
VRDPKERLRDILDGIANIERYAARGREAFESDELIQNWFVRHLQIIGEAARGLPKNFVIGKNPYPGLKSWVCDTSLFTTTLPWTPILCGMSSSATCRI